ncbi:MAG TPA: ATP-binding protein [Gemmatimonadales bacterium]|nr:ATP-binding protein [Gemmatimonadales bacterium]
MDPTAPLFVWVLIISALSVSAMLIVVAAAFAWHQRQALRQAQQWGRHLLLAQESERGRIAREIHDDVIQRLWSVRMMAQNNNGDEADTALDGIVGDLRTLAHDLHPPALRHLNLGDALRDMADRHVAGRTVEIEVNVPDQLSIDEATGLALYRVAQEALTNIAKHAAAAHARLTMSVSAAGVSLEVEDDGIGLRDTDLRHSFGLRGMRERIEMLGGKVTIESPTGEGTTVRAMVPTP